MDIQLFYTDNGDDRSHPPLILLHGNGSNSSSFFYVADHFKKTRRVITLDSRGHGHTPMGDKPFTLVQIAEDIKDFMDDMGIEKATLIGSSDGGNIALLFAREYISRLSGMVINGANIFPAGLKEHVYKSMLLDLKKAKRALRRNPADKNASRTIGLLKLMINEPDLTPEQLKNMNVPALVIVGNRDVIDEKHTELIVSSLPNARLSVLDGGHSIKKDNYDGYISEIERFLSENNL